ncbi:hypothetical protein A2Y99_04590 [Candidatus Gottesmanbacteria bacterium RBG_13_37_7]|uniref:Uncharacterized protein n=1 Tax=Candidatus Gottesmanbacteria bacterium RBG_13_37_7 TaxID=1798369 RepID=A0A1F5YGB3_9BACT|nr:MAG: hypothetical protein A2Y99_04590 [Candidatus Gottesmanbacteria bacterium RBG_13_37_7]
MKNLDNKFLRLSGMIFLVNIIILLIISLLFPSNLIFGNAQLSSLAALMLNGLLFTLAFLAIDPLYRNFNLKITSDIAWIFVYGIENILITWVFARLAKLTGLGISSYFIALFTGVILTVGQFMTVKNQPLAKKK